MTCVVCDRRGRVDAVRGFIMHVKCAPKAWVKEDRAVTGFMVRVRAGGWWTWPEKRKK
jgi:hypothetical protein